MKAERVLAGLSCSQVLASLTDYLDGELAPDARAALEAHVRACEHCARFGGVFAAVVRGLRERLGSAALDPGVGARLRTKLSAQLGASDERRDEPR